jgi:hypothetical protein
VLLLNGVRASVDGKHLYITDFSGTKESSFFGPVAANIISAVYKYDFDSEMLPINRRLFLYMRQGIADGIHVDDEEGWKGFGFFLMWSFLIRRLRFRRRCLILRWRGMRL